MNTQKDIKKIGATLKHGRFLALNVYMACFGFVFSFGAPIGFYFLLYKERQFAPVISYILIISLWAMFFFLSLYTLIKTRKIRKEIVFWLEDAVELDAYAVRWLRVDYDGIKVYFTYNNEKLSRTSRCKHWRSLEGHDLFWKDYIDKAFKIYYSPKYDEVMLFIVKPE